MFEFNNNKRDFSHFFYQNTLIFALTFEKGWVFRGTFFFVTVHYS